MVVTEAETKGGSIGAFPLKSFKMTPGGAFWYNLKYNTMEPLSKGHFESSLCVLNTDAVLCLEAK